MAPSVSPRRTAGEVAAASDLLHPGSVTSTQESPDDRPAHAVLAAELVPRGGPAPLRLLRVVGYAAAEATGGLLPPPSMSDLVVRQRDDGTEVLRLPAGDVPAAGLLLQHVTERLAEQTVAEFLESWGEPTPC